jgi:hypothetical protein
MARIPVDLQAKTRFIKDRCDRAINCLQQIVEQKDPIFADPRDVQLNLWIAEREIVNAYIAMKTAWWPALLLAIILGLMASPTLAMPHAAHHREQIAPRKFHFPRPLEQLIAVGHHHAMIGN